MIRSALCCLALVLILPLFASAEPTIASDEGYFVDDVTYQLFGSGFGPAFVSEDTPEGKARTSAMVVVGDHPDLAQCSLTLTQGNVYWREDTVEFDVVTGDFRPGDVVYVILIDAGGNPSPGWAVKVADPVDLGLPGPPGQPMLGLNP